MTDREAFLARWSRRKREAAAAAEESAAETPAAPAAEEVEKSEAPRAVPDRPQAEPAPELPPIDSIDGGTDVRAFLQEGVPKDLARAALRRAWSSDPAIRDFIGLSENAWDFTAPEGVPGFGPFSPDDARKLVAEMLGGTESAAGTEPSVPASAESDRSASGGDAELGIVSAPKSSGTQGQSADASDTPAEPGRGPEHTATQQQGAASKPPSRSSG
jgi:hypothetical protein